MNLYEAAKLVRNQSWNFIGAELAHEEANRVLIDAALSWLDKTPITEEWLRANGGKEIENLPGCFSVQGHDVDEIGKGQWMFSEFRIITTLGELRTLLRLCGAQEKENDA